jgi:catechol 2,3-dioxygenase-like lactoylglutathione lyase family enzyme
MVKYKGIDHLAMATGDMDRTVRFWRDLLGLRIVLSIGKPGYRQYFFEISENDLLAFFEWPGVEPIPEKDHGYPVTGPFGFDHVSLGVENGDDLWELKDKLTAADFWVTEVMDHGYMHSLYTFDPNGIAVEFSWSVAGAGIRRHPRMLDSEPPEVVLEGPEPQKDKWPTVERPTSPKDRKLYPGAGSELFPDGWSPG